jgi:hypothetical protein
MQIRFANELRPSASVPGSRGYASGPRPQLPETVRERVQDWAQTVERAVVAHPAKCLAGALFIGITLGWLIKR